MSRRPRDPVAVLGAGRAAPEIAALLAEAGARPSLAARRSRLNWNTVPHPVGTPLGGVAPGAARALVAPGGGRWGSGVAHGSSFGPSMRFVHGAGFTAGRLVKGVLERLGARGPQPGSTGGDRFDRAPAGHSKTYLR
ncbi:hypothetical protein ACWDYJ_09760 [Streptomyces sp. NPDC003042]